MRTEAEKAGIEAAVIEAILHDQVPPLAANDLVIHRYAAELNQYKSVSDATHAAAVALLGERGVVELTALVGYYTLVAMTLNSQEIPLPDDVVPAFPLPQHQDLR
jgi:4-carboxymuconolactone decarboxylase